jgi:hypothetical protein
MHAQLRKMKIPSSISSTRARERAVQMMKVSPLDGVAAERLCWHAMLRKGTHGPCKRTAI